MKTSGAIGFIEQPLTFNYVAFSVLQLTYFHTEFATLRFARKTPPPPSFHLLLLTPYFCSHHASKLRSSRKFIYLLNNGAAAELLLLPFPFRAATPVLLMATTRMQLRFFSTNNGDFSWNLSSIFEICPPCHNTIF